MEWWPWGDEAFAEAKRRDVPVFLSIGYATCHWCHVMAHESFEDEAVAALMNEAFVCVKVDREERPDLDDAYMAVCQAMTGRGGWPLTVLLTPERLPWFAGTYFPKQSRGHHLGMMDLVPRLVEAWSTKRDDIEHQAKHVFQHVSTPPATDALAPSPEWQESAFAALAQRFDAEHGGFGGAPKFPSAHTLLWLIDHHSSTGNADALNMVAKSLDGMAAGGMHDHVGGGFHRYSTDARWFLPHFEKMAYDQAMLLRAYSAGYAATGDERYRRVARGIIQFLERDLRHQEGGFFSAEDADAEGEEGKFTVWSHAEIEELLGEDAAQFAHDYGVQPEGNFHDESTGVLQPDNVLYLPGGLPEVDTWAKQREVLLHAREKRVRPLLDDKVLTDWNGLLIGALADASVLLKDSNSLTLANQAASFVLDNLLVGGKLRHRWHHGVVDEAAFLDDYAFLGDGLLRLFEATQEPKWLMAAQDLATAVVAQFEDASGGFHVAANGGELPVSRIEAYDGAIPSGNAMAAGFLWRLGRILGRPEFEEAARRTVARFSGQVAKHHGSFTTLLGTIDADLSGGREIVIVGTGQNAQDMVDAAREHRVPGQVVIHATDPLAKICAWVEPYQTQARETTAFVCRDYACQAPVDSAMALRKILKVNSADDF